MDPPAALHSTAREISPPTPKTPIWTLQGFLPTIGVILGTVTVIALVDGERFLDWTLLAFAYLLTPIGQEAWLITGPTLFQRTVWEILLFLFAIDTAVACFFVYGVDPAALVRRFPKVGRRIERFHAKVAQSKLARIGLPLALAVILLMPVHTGGAVIGSITGSTLGLQKPVTLTCVLVPILVRFLIAAGVITAFLSLL